MAERLLNLERRYSQLQTLLDQRTQELKESQAFLKKPDDVPESLVIRKIEDVNTRIFNMSMAIVDIFEQNPKMDLEETFVQEGYIDRCRSVSRTAVGELLYSSVCQVDEAIMHRLPVVPEDTIPMQLALRSVLLKWAMKVVGLPGNFPENNGTTELYKFIRVREPQSVSSQWRSIAFRASPPAIPSGAIVDEIMSLLCVCGLSSLNPQILFIRENIRKRTVDTERSLQELRSIIHTGVTSSDMEVSMVECDTPYDPSTMVDVFSLETRSSSNVQQVLCTVGLGIRKTTAKMKELGEFHLVTELLKRPEVALVQLLDSFKKPADRDFDAHLDQS
ncbi:hypothetical protein JR316_0002735 [Psilocybe cubensis]|nr:hypothetical protein JR316_0002735 [Psilocybe cubensis]KAH9485820.1 hypothetical protein JR316_0002735 [Psilocybe cubensis]